MKNIMGKAKDDDPWKAALKEDSVRMMKKLYPLSSKRRICRKLDKLDKSLSKGNRKGLGLK